jgi:very-short-patch-repair endonuclease
MPELLRGDWPKTLEELEERKGKDQHPLPAGEGRGEGMTHRNPPNFTDTLAHARELRGRSTSAEFHLWRHLLRRSLKNAKFRRRHPIGPYIVDFYCKEAMLIIEIDGGGHGISTQSSEDIQRTRELERLGFRVLRFWNNEVLQNTEGVLQTIAEALARPPP